MDYDMIMDLTVLILCKWFTSGVWVFHVNLFYWWYRSEKNKEIADIYGWFKSNKLSLYTDKNKIHAFYTKMCASV